MDLQSRKLEFIQAFLKIGSESIISKLENVLKESTEYQNHERLTDKELHERIDQSETDFREGRFKTQEEVERKYKR
jgi:hypothetical protein